MTPLRFVWELIMFRRCCRLILLCGLAFWSLMVAAAPAQLDQSNFTLDELHWLATHDELVVGMPSAA